jgi:hypothetical protein
MVGYVRLETLKVWALGVKDVLHTPKVWALGVKDVLHTLETCLLRLDTAPNKQRIKGRMCLDSGLSETIRVACEGIQVDISSLICAGEMIAKSRRFVFKTCVHDTWNTSNIQVNCVSELHLQYAS